MWEAQCCDALLRHHAAAAVTLLPRLLLLGSRLSPSRHAQPRVIDRPSVPVHCVTRPLWSSCRRGATAPLACLSCQRATRDSRPWRRAVPGTVTQTPPPPRLLSRAARVTSVYILRDDCSCPLAAAGEAAVNPGCGGGQAGRALLPCCCEAAVDKRQREQRHTGAQRSVSIKHTHEPLPRLVTKTTTLM